jgi:hypothetical protein
MTLLSLYFLNAASMKIGVISYFLARIQMLCRSNPMLFYFFSVALASFFPFQRQVDAITRHIKLSFRLPKTAPNPIFPSLFGATASLTIAGSIANLQSDHICNTIFKGEHWGFFSLGPISIPLFCVCFFSLWFEFRSQKNNDGLSDSVKPVLMPNQSSQLNSSLYRIDRQAFKGGSVSLPSSSMALVGHVKKKESWASTWMALIFLLFILLSIVRVKVFYSAPLCGVLMLPLKGICLKKVARYFPIDTFLLLISSFLFAYLFLDSGFAQLVAKYLTCLNSKISIVTFFLFLSAVVSSYIPSLMVVSLLMVVVNFLPSCCDPSFLQVVAASVTCGSFLILKSNAKRGLRYEFLDGPAKIKIFILCPLLVYFVFVIHIFLFYIVD